MHEHARAQMTTQEHPREHDLTDRVQLREHLEWLAEQGRPLPGDPTLVSAAMGTMLSSLAYAILRTESTGLSDDQVLDTLTALLADGLRGA